MLVANSSNWVRAESLEIPSIEMFALIAGLVVAWRYRHHGLVTLFAISLPFNDIVYRLGPVTISDVLAIALLVRRRPSPPWLIAPLFFWMGWGLLSLLYSADDDASTAPALFAISYGVRFVIILLVMGTLDLSGKEARICVAALRSVTILAASVSVVQVVVFKLGLPVNGVFAASGFVRPKGLSHEPSTSAAWFAMAIPLLAVTRGRNNRMDRRLLAAILVGLFLTLSVSAVVLVGVQVVYYVGRSLRSGSVRLRVKRYALMSIPVVLIVVVFFGGQATLLATKGLRVVDEFTSGPPRETGTAQPSGREGDLVLLAEYPPQIFFGEGLFVAPELAESIGEDRATYVPAANIVITTAIETGVVGLFMLLAALGSILIGAWRDLKHKTPEFVVGFAGFLAVTLGQRLLAFPQPWFMLAVARGLSKDNALTEPAPAPTAISSK